MQIARSFQNLQPTIQGAEPEQVIVLETLTESVNALAEAVAGVPGLEWLADLDWGESEPFNGFSAADDQTKKLPRRLYALFTSQQAMNSLLALWEAWLQEPDKRAARGCGPFKRLFVNLSDIRRWGAADRISETGILEAWREDVEVKGLRGFSRFEVELWYRTDTTRREALTRDVLSRVQAVGGRQLSSCSIEEIRYHALLIEIPSAYIQELLTQLQHQQYVQLLLAEGVMFFRPQAQSSFRLVQSELPAFDLTAKLLDAAVPQGNPVAAVFDGFPLANHSALAGRIIVSDWEGQNPRL